MKTAFDKLMDTKEGRKHFSINCFYINIQECLCKVRDELQLTDKQFAEVLGIKKSKLHKILDDRAFENGFTVKQLAKLFAKLELIVELKAKKIRE
jgi:predicted transcriptional regulator